MWKFYVLSILLQIAAAGIYAHSGTGSLAPALASAGALAWAMGAIHEGL